MKIVLLDDYADALRRVGDPSPLAGHDFVVHTEPARDADGVVARLADADVAILIQQRVWMTAAMLERLPRLRFISQTGRNFAHIDLAACTGLGILVGGSSVAGGGDATAEFTWGLILAAIRDIPRQVERLKAGQWLDAIGTTLSGKTLGIYSFGKIGSVVARYGKAFDMRVVCWGRDGSLARAREAGFEVAQNREAFFAEADVLSLHIALNAETRGIVTAADLALMKPTALLVNTSRAGIVAPGALHAALVAGRPGFGAVDVYESEPVLDGDHPLLRLPNALCTPHLGYSTDLSYKAMLKGAVDRVLAFAGGSLDDIVNPEAVAHRR